MGFGGGSKKQATSMYNTANAVGNLDANGMVVGGLESFLPNLSGSEATSAAGTAASSPEAQSPLTPPPIPLPPPASTVPTLKNAITSSATAVTKKLTTATNNFGAGGTIATSPSGIKDKPQTAKATLLGK